MRASSSPSVPATAPAALRASRRGVAERLEGGDDVRVGRRWATRGDASGMDLLLELQDDALRGLAADAGDAGVDVDVIGHDRQLELRHRVCRRDGQRQPRADLRDRHEQLEEGELLGGGEAEERLLVLADEVVGEDRCVRADPQLRQQRRPGDHAIADPPDLDEGEVEPDVRDRPADRPDHPSHPARAAPQPRA